MSETEDLLAIHGAVDIAVQESDVPNTRSRVAALTRALGASLSTRTAAAQVGSGRRTASVLTRPRRRQAR